MHQDRHITLGSVQYNAVSGAYEARVDIEREGHIFRYPCLVHGPLDMDETLVRERLAAHALRQSDSGRGLHSLI